MKTVPTTTLGEVARTKAPGVLVEIAYHDNAEDAQWIRDNIDAIAANLVYSLTEYFGIPFNTPQPIFNTTVATNGGNLNVRYTPSVQGAIVGKVPNGAEVTVYAQLPDWTLIEYNGITGYVSSRFLLT